ncbi:hypothetical protein B1J92_A04477g [Nakaseomyces glabratus]|nr:hypothetical protein B1J91_A04477g [Nakaseomyces glabratus]OXB50755.1 hypothetical protein B1J92_A04477g [Nakaseomyces glabratus]
MLKKWLPSSKKKQSSKGSAGGSSAPVTPLKGNNHLNVGNRKGSTPTITRSAPNNAMRSSPSLPESNNDRLRVNNNNDARKDSFGNAQGPNLKLNIVEPQDVGTQLQKLNGGFNTTNSSNESLPSEHLHNPILNTERTELTPYGDGSNKIFGYENFGNTCYCNSVLQCLYNLPEFRNDMLRYPLGQPKSGKSRKLEMPGLKPRMFLPEHFEPRPTQEVPKKSSSFIKSTFSAVTSSQSNLLEDKASQQTERPPPINLSTKSSTNSLNHDAVKMRSNSEINVGTTNASISNDIPNTEINDNGDSHRHESWVPRKHSTDHPDLTVEGQPNIDKHHSKRVIVGRNYPKLYSAENSDQILQNNIHLKSEHLTNEQRKKSALINGPIVNVDHQIDSSAESNLYNGLKDIFECITEHSYLTGVVTPSAFIEMLKRENVLFSSMMHQDAHEFLIFLLNEISDFLDKQNKNALNSKIYDSSQGRRNSGTVKNFVSDIFQGTLTNRIKCLTCDNTTARDEPFLDFPIEVQENVDIDIQEILESFHQKEMLHGPNKFYCDECCGLQEAERVVGLKQLPKTLALHLKRFKYSEQQNSNIKLFDKVSYPLDLKVSSTFNPSISKNYELSGIVVHMGGGPQHGHYISLCKNEKFGWLLFDDETVEAISEQAVLQYTGNKDTMTTAYVLFYQESQKEGISVDHDTNINKLIEYDDWLRTKPPTIIKEEEEEDTPSSGEVIETGRSVTNEDTKKNKTDVIIDKENDKEKKNKSSRRKSKLFGFMKG